MNFLDFICKNAAIATANTSPTESEKPCQKPKTLKHFITYVWKKNDTYMDWLLIE